MIGGESTPHHHPQRTSLSSRTDTTVRNVDWWIPRLDGGLQSVYDNQRLYPGILSQSHTFQYENPKAICSHINIIVWTKTTYRTVNKKTTQEQT
jgi:hypothetical protein